MSATRSAARARHGNTTATIRATAATPQLASAPRWCSAQAAAERLGVGIEHVYRLLGRGTLRGRRVCGHSGQTRVWRVDAAHLDDYAARRVALRRRRVARCSVAQAAARLDLSTGAVLSRLRTGSLAGRRVPAAWGHVWQIDAADVERLAAQLAARPETRGSYLRARRHRA